jgi:primosomal protein N' (replication factor Y)
MKLSIFEIYEKIMNILLKIRNISHKNFLVQTRQTEEYIFDFALQGNLIDFHRNELEERKQFAYPPFTTLIKISYQGKHEEVAQEMENLKNFLQPYQVAVFPAFTESIKGKYTMHTLIKLEKSKWIDKKLTEKLLALPTQFSVKVDPDNLL